MALPPSSTHQYEATVLPVSLEKLWTALKAFDWAQILPSRVASSVFTDGGVGTVGSHVRVSFNDGHNWVYHIVEVSDIYHKLVFELVAAEPELTYTGALHTIRLYRDTLQGQTFMVWETDFANDAGLDIVQDSKYKKHEFFTSASRSLSN